VAINQTNRLIEYLCRSIVCDGAGRTDGELLETFLRQKDDAALAALVRRHGPMVWGVCCRMLRNHHDAEDAFQATFLVFVQKATALPDKEMVGNWLYGVAHQTAVRMRALAAKRGVRERQVAVMPEPTSAEQYVWNDLQPVLDEELARLPDKYRVLIVLCDLAGNTRKDVARQLDIPEGTVASRLATARMMLAKRLSRRGVLSGVLLGALLSSHAASACVPLSVISSTIKTATLVAAGQVAAGAVSPTVAALLTGVTRATFMTRIKSVLAVVLVAALCFGGAGAGLFKWPVAVAQQPGSENQPPQVTAKAPDDNSLLAPAPVPARKGELAALEQKLVGTWIGTGGCDGKMVFQADGTYHVTHWTVGLIYGTGKWKIQWSELPPTLLLSHPRLSIERGFADPKKPTKVSLLTLNDKALNFGYPEPNGSPAGTHKRGTKSDDMRIRLTILDQGVQSYLGSKGKLPPNLTTLVDAKILWPESLVDPWGKKFQYDITGKKTGNKEVPDIWTETPDKNIIGNWSR
jgi:RNA polymerase sigma factor (sigma-70 family)